MASRNPHLPSRVPKTVFSKIELLADLQAVDTDTASRARVLALENGFRARVQSHIASLPIANALLENFNTSPFVLMIYAQAKQYTRLSELEGDILPAKLFSSMETSAGRMVEDVALPVYGWQAVLSGMHSANSALDGKKLALPILKAATLKSGPRCLNDEMSENFADSVLGHGPTWLSENGASQLDFTYGVLYGTKKQSNKKDWHILRNIAEKLPSNQVVNPPWQQWECQFKLARQPASATIRIGKDWWDYLGGPLCLTELCAALIRACVAPGPVDPSGTRYTISDLSSIVAWPKNQSSINVSILQASQMPWFFFLMRHFCDEMTD
jgi:Type II restriction endonuclease EcoO109I